MRDYLIELRKNAGLTQQDVAEKVGVSRQYYNMIEVGERQKKMDISMAAGLAAVLGVPITTIVEQEKMRT